MVDENIRNTESHGEGPGKHLEPGVTETSSQEVTDVLGDDDILVMEMLRDIDVSSFHKSLQEEVAVMRSHIQKNDEGKEYLPTDMLDAFKKNLFHALKRDEWRYAEYFMTESPLFAKYRGQAYPMEKIVENHPAEALHFYLEHFKEMQNTYVKSGGEIVEMTEEAIATNALSIKEKRDLLSTQKVSTVPTRYPVAPDNLNGFYLYFK